MSLPLQMEKRLKRRRKAIMIVSLLLMKVGKAAAAVRVVRVKRRMKIRRSLLILNKLRRKRKSRYLKK